MEEFKKIIKAVYKEKGEQWLDDLPQQLKQFEKQLDIKLKEPFKELSYNYTAPAIDTNGKPLVFKYGLPNPELNSEIDALKFYNGHGAVKLINANVEEGWLLLERCDPGECLTTAKDDKEATVIAAHVMQQLFQPIKENTSFPTINDWFNNFKSNKETPKPLMDFAKSNAKDLLQSQGELVLLHGDLHHYNILSSQRDDWLAIDPKGVIGEREYEVGALMRNPYSLQLTKSILRTRLDILSEMTGFDRQRLLLWSAVQAVLAASWNLQNEIDGAERLLEIAKTLKELCP